MTVSDLITILEKFKTEGKGNTLVLVQVPYYDHFYEPKIKLSLASSWQPKPPREFENNKECLLIKPY